jgi:CDGSH-type Zn-finger protein
MRCPTGALHFARKDGGPAEPLPVANTVQVRANGPLYLRGDVAVTLADGSVLKDTRAALCRCGASSHKPFCDNSHREVGFAASSSLGENKVRTVDLAGNTAELRVTPSAQGPLRLEGDFELLSGDGRTIYRGNRVSLCRCGGSANKPFCDGTHSRIAFAG